MAFVPPLATLRISPASIGSFMSTQTKGMTALSSSSDTDIEKVTEHSNKLDVKKKMSRPERKALERKNKFEPQKRNHRRKHNYKEREKELTSSKEGEDPFSLHSRHIKRLNSQSTADDVMKAIKRAQNLHDVHDIRHIENFLLEEVDETFAYGYRGSLLARLTVAALHMSNHDLARKAIDVRRTEHRSNMLPFESAAIVRGMLRVHNVTDAVALLDDELSLPLSGIPLNISSSRDRIKHRALSIASIASRHFFEGEPSMAVRACGMLAEMGPIVRESGLLSSEINVPWTRIVQGAAQCEAGRRNGSVVPCLPEVELPCNLVYSVLNAMATFPSDNNDSTYEAVSNALVRRILFVTGAVSIDGCPKADRGEVIFMGRSNVGKSSLVNMVTNRKSLAYTSKTPGKTQQFNFFAVNDKPGREKEIKYGDDVPGEKDKDSFHIVDVPGFGFAKVSVEQREKWSELLSLYIKTRKSLRVVFHLVDSRHGLIDEDINIMRQMGDDLPKYTKYVVVLTKADKNKKGSSLGKVSKEILNDVRNEMKVNGLVNSPILLTSATTNLGRDDMWRYLKLAAEV